MLIAIVKQAKYVAGLFMGSLLCLQGCDATGCDGLPYHPQPGSPLITHMDMIEQLPTDPWEVVFGIEYTDTGGDVGGGQASFYIGANNAPLTLDLQGPFESSALPLNATAGRFAIKLRFVNTIQDGSIVRLGTQLQDASLGANKGLRSNCYVMDLLFNVKQAALLQIRQPMAWFLTHSKQAS